MARKYLSVRLSKETVRELEREAKRRGETVEHVIEQRLAIATMKSAALVLDFGGIRVPVKTA